MPATTASHQRSRSPGRGEAEQDQVEARAEELLTLWRVLSAALARDSAGQLRSDRQAKGAAEGSAATVNVDVVDAAVLVETGVAKLVAEVVPLLNLDRRPRTVYGVLSAVPDWHRSLAGRGLPLAEYMRRDLGSWLRTVRQAIGVRRHDEHLGSLCPDHRAERPTELRLEGAQARIAASLLAGPPPRWSPAPNGPACARCTAAADEQHEVDVEASSRRTRRRRKRRDQVHWSCAAVLAWQHDRRPLDLATGQLSDWVRRGGEWSWRALDGAPAWTWTESGRVLCPHCRRTWSTLSERRLLAAELRALGDQRNPSMEAIIR